MNIIFHKFEFPIYGVCIVSSIILSFIFIFYMLQKTGIDKEKIVLSFMLVIIFIVGFGTSFSNLVNHTKGYTLSSYGGAIGLIFAVIIFNFIYKKDKNKFLETYVLALPLMYGISKLGCFFVGCCHGIKYNGLFNVTYIDISMTSYLPIQLIETIVFLIIFVIGVIFYNKNNKYIKEYIFIVCGLFKFLLDYLRYSHVNKILSINQIISIIFILIGIILITRNNNI